MNNIKYINHKYLPEKHTIDSFVVNKDYIVIMGKLQEDNKVYFLATFCTKENRFGMHSYSKFK
jgi:hypothetical protein